MAINFTAPIKRSLLNFGSVLQAATHYLKDGFQPIPVKYKDKAPLNKDWQNSKSVAEDLPGLFSGQCNVGLLLGDPSGGLVDIDIDDPFAQMFAYLLLPTEMKHGRSSRPNSHHFYIVEGDLKTTQFKDQNGAMLIEIRSTGAQTVVPPSVHPCGEQLAYSAYGPPTKISAATLLAIVSKLAAYGLLAKYWPVKGSRNEAAMALAGTLLRGGWTEEDTSTFLQSIAKAAGDEEWQLRSDCVKHTSTKLKDGEPVTGLPTLVNIFGDKLVTLFCKWLPLSADSEESPVEVVQRLNKTYAVVTVGSSVRILCETFDPHTGHPDIKLFDAKDLKLLCKNQKIQVKIDSGKPVCRTADGCCGRCVLMRVRTTFFTPPQHAHRTTGRGLGSTGLSVTLSRSCNSAIVLLALGCKKPKLRARRNPLGKVCCKTNRRNSTPLTVRVSNFPVFPFR